MMVLFFYYLQLFFITIFLCLAIFYVSQYTLIIFLISQLNICYSRFKKIYFPAVKSAFILYLSNLFFLSSHTLHSFIHSFSHLFSQANVQLLMIFSIHSNLSVFLQHYVLNSDLKSKLNMKISDIIVQFCFNIFANALSRLFNSKF